MSKENKELTLEEIIAIQNATIEGQKELYSHNYYKNNSADKHDYQYAMGKSAISKENVKLINDSVQHLALKLAEQID